MRPPSPAERVVVVGGSGAIGSAVVDRHLAVRDPVVIVDAATPEGDTEADFLQVDVVDRAAISGMTAYLASSGGLAHLVSLAGGALPDEFEPLPTTPIEVIAQSIELNLTSHIMLVQALTPLLAAADGDRSVTLVSSINALRDFGLPAYSAAKAGLLGLVASLTTELGAHGIRINAVLPGTVPTPRTEDEPKDFATLARGTALGRLTTTGEVAEAVFALTRMTAVTGQTLVVDCGQTMTTVVSDREAEARR